MSMGPAPQLKLPAIGRKGVAAVAAAKSLARRKKKSRGPPAASPFAYHYVVGKGNNSRLVLAALRARPWFAPAPADAKAGDRVFAWEMYRNRKRFREAGRRVACNHLEANTCLVNKDGLYRTMRKWCGAGREAMERFMPLTFHLLSTEGDEHARFVSAFEASRAAVPAEEEEERSASAPAAGDEGTRRRRRSRKPREAAATNLWICKPAAMSNRGFGIKVSNDLAEIDGIVGREARKDARCGGFGPRGWVVQKYIERPLLVDGRKFDIRAFCLLVTDKAGRVHAYAHRRATYVRTSSTPYSLKASDFGNRGVHLVNDGVQNKEKNYGQYEAGNKLSLADFRERIAAAGADAPEGWIEASLVPRVEELMHHCVEAASGDINPNKRTQCFELLGFDFMLDDDLNVLLIEINSNPCLELGCPLLENSLPQLILDVMRVGLDQVLPPPKPSRLSRRQAEALEALQAADHGFVKVFTPGAAEDEPDEDMAELDEILAEAPAPAGVDKENAVVGEGVAKEVS